MPVCIPIYYMVNDIQIGSWDTKGNLLRPMSSLAMARQRRALLSSVDDVVGLWALAVVMGWLTNQPRLGWTAEGWSPKSLTGQLHSIRPDHYKCCKCKTVETRLVRIQTPKTPLEASHSPATVETGDFEAILAPTAGFAGSPRRRWPLWRRCARRVGDPVGGVHIPSY